MILKFKGKVETGDACRVSDEKNGALFIGGVDVVDRVTDKWSSKTKVFVALGDSTFSGELFVECGWGYSEWTPMDSDELKVGEHDLIAEIESRHNGEEITLWIGDEPINVLDDYKIEEPSNGG